MPLAPPQGQHSVKHLLLDKEVNLTHPAHLLPTKLTKNISKSKRPKKSFETFMKGIRL